MDGDGDKAGLVSYTLHGKSPEIIPYRGQKMTAGEQWQGIQRMVRPLS